MDEPASQIRHTSAHPRSTLQLSSHTRHAVAAPRPRLRGLFHRAAALVWIPVGYAWVSAMPDASRRMAIAAFVGGIGVMFAASALLHLRPWPSLLHERLLRLDHTGIYLAISGTAVAIGLLGLSGWARVALVVGASVGALLGIALEWLPFAPPRGFSNTIYLTLGWLPLMLMPWIWWQSGTLVVVLLLTGGVLYTLGAVIVGMRRPNPSPLWFGYHEIFHVLVIAAVALHAAALTILTAR